MITDNLNTKRWYETWFDSPYYHLLYQHRDEQEAKQLIDHLFQKLPVAPTARILDMACGRGRHAIYLHQKGFNVTGVDLSEASIAFARQFETKNLSFNVHNIHNPYRVNHYDVCLNLFTSFGYDERDEDNFRVITSAVADLRVGGYFVLDYFNTEYLFSQKITSEQRLFLDEIEFNICRSAANGFVMKSIRVVKDEKLHFFQERVKHYTLSQLLEFYEQAQLEVVAVYGDYNMNNFDPLQSNRIVLIGKKSFRYEK